MKNAITLSIVCVVLSVVCVAQQNMPDAPSEISTPLAQRPYLPPTQGERFQIYVRHTFWIDSIVEAGVRGGIDQARDNPSQWPEGGQGYADRFGSAMGQIVVRGTTEYLVSDLLREDLRRVPCGSQCTGTIFKRALEDTFTARKDDDGHRAFSVARLLGPVAGGTVATAAWYPSGYRRGELFRQTAVSYAFEFVRNCVREVAHR